MTAAAERNCPLCDRAPEYSTYEIDRDMFAVECATCGRFKITDLALSALNLEQKFLLSAFCRRAKSGSKFVTILSENHRAVNQRTAEVQSDRKTR
jgi:hypothetical protein